MILINNKIIKKILKIWTIERLKSNVIIIIEKNNKIEIYKI